MRYFKLIVDPKSNNYDPEWGLKLNEIYSLDLTIQKRPHKIKIKHLVKHYPHEWQEVFLLTQEHLDEVKKLHEKVEKISSTMELKKDQWHGVEFAEHAFNNYVFKISSIDETYIYGTDGSEVFRQNCKPSTGETYKAQLEKTAFEKYGEIKAGDKFDRTPISKSWEVGEIEKFDKTGFEYTNHNDTLYFNGLAIYSMGRWATKIHEKTEVISSNCTGEAIDDKPKDCEYSFHFKIVNRLPKHDAPYMYNKALPFLASQLEKYLNGELEEDKQV